MPLEPEPFLTVAICSATEPIAVAPKIMKVLLTSCDEHNFGRITTLPLEIPEDATVDRLKAEAAHKQGLAPMNLRLCVNLSGVKVSAMQVLLAEGQLCSFYRIVEGSAIHQEIVGQHLANRKTETFQQSRYFRKLGIGEPLPVIEERPTRLLDQLITACKSGRVDELSALCAEADRQEECLLEDGEDEYIASRSDKQGWTCYHYAAFKGFAKVVQFLNSKGCNPNKESKDGWTPLQLASYQGHLDCVKELLKHPSIQINRLTARGAALHQACAKGHDEVAQFLLEHNACMTQEDSHGRIPLEVSSKTSIIEMIPRYMGQRQLASILASKSQEVKKPYDPAPFCGEVSFSAPLALNDKKVYLVLDPGAGTLMRYENQKSFLANEKVKWSAFLTDIQSVTKSCTGFFGKKKFAFVVEHKSSKQKFICPFQELVDEWVERISYAVDYCQVNGIGAANPRSSFTFRKSVSDPMMPELEERKTFSNTAGSQCSSTAEDDIGSPADEPRRELETVSFSSFAVIEELGSGSFGKVYKVRKLSDGGIFAMKSLSKQFLLKQRQLKYAVSECRILKSLVHPFVIRLFHAFQTPKSLYMVLEYCSNGDLAAHLSERGTFEEVEARFYIAETLLAICYLHSQDIVYRDLKPENILLDRKGHIRLADFGLAKEGVGGMNTTKSFCGSPAYLAPEVVNQNGSGKPADVYGLGAILYEMLTGEPPFYSENTRELMANIRTQTKLNFPAHISEEAKDLVRIALNKDPTKRPTAKDIKTHAFFRKLNWDKLERVELEPPVLGAGWKQDEDSDPEEQDIYPMKPVDKDYSTQPTMEECLLDFD